MDTWPQPSLRDLGDAGVLCTFSNAPAAAAAAGIARSSQLSSWAAPYLGKRYYTRQPQYLAPLHPSTPAMQGKTSCWVGSLRPSAYVELTNKKMESSQYGLHTGHKNGKELKGTLFAVIEIGFSPPPPPQLYSRSLYLPHWRIMLSNFMGVRWSQSTPAKISRLVIFICSMALYVQKLKN